MRENEQIARWLNHPALVIKSDGSVGEKHSAYVMSFRESNEWAGALLDKLGDHSIRVNCNNSLIKGKWYFSLRFNNERWYFDGKESWRDAVADAVLEIIKRESVAGSASTEHS